MTVIVVVTLSAHCTQTEDGSDITGLSQDEAYLVDIYKRATHALEQYPVTPLFVDSLFAVFDSTIDTLRIANTIDALNRNPERWILIFREINRTSQISSQGQTLEETR